MDDANFVARSGLLAIAGGSRGSVLRYAPHSPLATFYCAFGAIATRQQRTLQRPRQKSVISLTNKCPPTATKRVEVFHVKTYYRRYHSEYGLFREDFS